MFIRFKNIATNIIMQRTKMIRINTIINFYNMVLQDYFKGKAEHFPTWSGLPKIVVADGLDPLKRTVSIGWYVQVPRAHAVDPDQKEEDTLWDS